MKIRPQLFKNNYPWTRLASCAALLCFGLLSLPIRLHAVTVTSADIQIRGDDRYDLYFNGVYISPHTNPAECFFDAPFYCKQVPMTWTIPAGLIDCGDNVLAVIMYDIPGGGLYANYVMTFNYSDASTEQIQSDSASYNASSRIDTWYAGDQASGFLTDPPMQGVFDWTDVAYVPAGATSAMAPCLATTAASVGNWYRAGYDLPGGGVYGSPCCPILDAGGLPTSHIFASDCNPTNQWPTIGLSPATSTWYFRHTFTLAGGPICLPTPTATPVCNYIEDLFPVNTVGLAGNTWNIQTGLQTWDGNWAVSDVGDTGWWSVGNPLHSTEPIVSVTAWVRWRSHKNGPDAHLLFNYCVATNDCTAPAVANVLMTNSFDSLWESASFTVTPPAGGWTWAKLSNLAVYLQNDTQGGGSGSTKVIDVDNVRLIVEFIPLCGTPSFTPTVSATQTRTRTVTPTGTFSSTATPSSTSTATPTVTASATPTATFTVTPSSTQTVTSTRTATLTDTPTQSFTFTPTPSWTATPSATPTVTQSDTSTQTVTWTGSPTYSSTSTVSPTLTGTETSTVTPTATPTATATDTSTETVTRSGTPTATPSYTLTSTPSITMTSTQTSTASPSATQTVTPSDTPMVTATPTLTATETSTETPSFSASVTPSATPSATPTFTVTSSASETPSATPSSTASGTRTATPTLTDSPTALPSITVSPTVSPTFTISATLTPMPPLQVTMRIYNSAGELVYALPGSLALFQSPTGVSVLQPNFVPDDGQQGAFLLSGAEFTASWDGRDDNGQTVSSGTYHVVFNITDNYNQSTTYQTAVQVTRVVTQTVVEVSNSAGELVWREAKAGGTPSFLRIDGADSFQPDPASGAGLKIRYGPGPADEVTWDGRSLNGAVVASGAYVVKVTREEQGKGKTVLTESVTVLAAPGGDLLRGLTASPNPVGPASRQVIVTLPNLPVTGSATAVAYNLAGERVTRLTRMGKFLVWDLGRQTAAPGIYLIRVEADDGLGKHEAAMLKIAVVR